MTQQLQNQIAFKVALHSTYIVPPPPGQERAAFEEHFRTIKAAIEAYEAMKCRQLTRLETSRN